jgi:indole-3-glycerol phosphate synthase
MNRFLDRVVLEKQAELAARKQSRPQAELEDRARHVQGRDFGQALRGGFRIIAEIKQKSPTVAAFRQGRDPRALAGEYAAGGAAAISIVTDAKNFGTSLADVGPVRETVPLPVLVKEFVIDPYQVAEARAAGADALLLIARLLETDRLKNLLDRVHGFGMAALVECHDKEDVARAAAAGANIIGVNNRDLRTLEVSLERTRRLAPLIPDGALCVAESGIGGRAQIEELAALGADAFLIGGTLLNAQDPGRKLRELLASEPGDQWP